MSDAINQHKRMAMGQSINQGSASKKTSERSSGKSAPKAAKFTERSAKKGR